MPACLPEQLCSIRVGSEPHSSSVLGRRRLREERAHGRRELLRRREVRRRRDRDLLGREIVAGPHERERLKRLRRGAEEGDEISDRRPPRRPRRPGPQRRGRGGAIPRRRRGGTTTVIGSTARVYETGVDKRAGSAVWSGIVAHSLAVDYDAPDTLVVSETAQLRALGDEVRGPDRRLAARARCLGERAAKVLEMPKGTVGHHLKVLERAGSSASCGRAGCAP